ncbi:GNAT family N-acetyltransferase [Actinocorallia populi]|uniref:GNAT family N-acetyltransferase n=1 Tax=Actinocorallia populi TaxID=2079200 RepID=UPI000D0925D9|nr:GNAT family N-acetyltransferase [Actinocorallia populi]
MSVEIRLLEMDDDDVAQWWQARSIGYLGAPTAEAHDLEYMREILDFSRTWGAFEDGRCVATYRSFDHEVTAPGGATVPSSAVSAVTVSPTHRRQGLLTRMIEPDLRRFKEAGNPVASLIAAEYPIYGRYGFGPAAWLTDFRIDAMRAMRPGPPPGPQDGGRVVLADAQRVRKEGPWLHERIRRKQHGFVTRPGGWWKKLTGSYQPTGGDWKEPYYALYLAADGTVDGMVAYTAVNAWNGGMPDGDLHVQDLLAYSPAAERALWHYLCSIDWVTRVHAPSRAPDDLLPLLVGDARAAVTTACVDHLWLRPLDVPAMLTARSYPAEGRLVLDVRDEAGLAQGRFLLEAGPDGASCAPTALAADLTLPAAALGGLYLGDESAVRLAALGRLDEERAGAAAAADTLLRASRRAWCPDIF